MKDVSELDFHELEAAGAFKNTIESPRKINFYSYNIYQDGEVLGKNVNVVEYKYLITTYPNALVEKIFDEQSYRECLNEFNNEENRIYKLFKDTLFEEFGVTFNEKKEKCFALAWEHGHSSGFDEVYNYFSEFVVLIR